MAKLKNSVKPIGNTKLPSVSSNSVSSGNLPKKTTTTDGSSKLVGATQAGSIVQALGFGALHTKVTGSVASPLWSGLLSAATSGGGSGLLGGGFLSGGALGLIGKLFSLFGGGKSTPVAPVPFVAPAPQVISLNVGSPASVSSVSLGVQSNVTISAQGGPAYQQTAAAVHDHATQTAQVVQIVKQALLTSSSLNDVISEI